MVLHVWVRITKRQQLIPHIIACNHLDINECADGSDNCASNATCMNIPGNFLCSCNHGYTGDGTTCVGKIDSKHAINKDAYLHKTIDIDECDNGRSSCSVNATCTNTPGDFICTCNQGYSGDGTTCVGQYYRNCALKVHTTIIIIFIDIDECISGNNCSPNATCMNTPGDFICTCNPGYSGDGVTCSGGNSKKNK